MDPQKIPKRKTSHTIFVIAKVREGTQGGNLKQTPERKAALLALSYDTRPPTQGIALSTVG